MPARPLLVTSPLLQGADVLALQRRLTTLGFDPGPLDGVYGPATEWAVRASEASGVPGSDIGRRALAEARRWVGTTESPPGSNRTPFGAWFGLDGVPWCNIFVSYCFAVGAGTTIAAGFHGAGCTSRGCAYVPTTEAWLRATGMWLGRVLPRAGDLAIYNWDGGPPDHIGIVESAAGEAFAAIEGNSGGAVARRKRTLGDVDGFGRVHSLRTAPELDS